MDAIVNTGPREDSTRIGSQGTVRRQAVDVSPLRRVNQAISLITIGVRESAFRNVKSVAECLADEIINAAKGSSNSYAIKKKEYVTPPLHTAVRLLTPRSATASSSVSPSPTGKAALDSLGCQGERSAGMGTGDEGKMYTCDLLNLMPPETTVTPSVLGSRRSSALGFGFQRRVVCCFTSMLHNEVRLLLSLISEQQEANW